MFVFTYRNLCLRQIAHTALNIRFVRNFGTSFIGINYVYSKQDPDAPTTRLSFACVNSSSFLHSRVLLFLPATTAHSYSHV